jgi:hypothetical protein
MVPDEPLTNSNLRRSGSYAPAAAELGEAIAAELSSKIVDGPE